MKPQIGTTCQVAAMVCALGVSSASGAVKYTVLDLGTLGQDSKAYVVNDAGQVAGTCGNDATLFRTAANQPINPSTDNLGSLGIRTIPNAINNAGVVVGYSSLPAPAPSPYGGPSRGFRVAPGQKVGDAGTSLGGPPSLLHDCRGYGINDAGEAVGSYWYPDTGLTYYQAFRTAPGAIINPSTDDLGPFASDSATARSINNSGQIAGNFYPETGPSRVFRIGPNRHFDPATDDLGNLGGDALARQMNASGQIAGGSLLASGIQHAFRTTDTGGVDAASDLGALAAGMNSEAWGINDAGDVVGWSGTSTTSAHAIIVRGNGPMIDLNTLIDPLAGWTLCFGMDINNHGQIVGWGYHSGYGTRAYLLTPVPEPDALALLVLGFALIRRQRSR